MTSKADQIIKALQLQPHIEGGYYRETYRSNEEIEESALDKRYSGGRSVSTCIYFMLTANTFSTMHRVKSDEIYHFYCGSPLELLILRPDGTSETVIIGPDPLAGHHPQFVIQRGWWQGSRVQPPGEFGLIGATVAPGFDFSDFEIGQRDDLIAGWPDAADMITALCNI